MSDEGRVNSGLIKGLGGAGKTDEEQARQNALQTLRRDAKTLRSITGYLRSVRKYQVSVGKLLLLMGGWVVRSTAGRDKNRLFVVVCASDDINSVFVADGKLRKTGFPKRKNVKHVAFEGVRYDGEFEDAAIREFLRSYKDGSAESPADANQG